MMDSQPNTTDPKKVFDVSPPDQTMPSASGRPIIVSNKPEQTDQMVQVAVTPTEAPAPPPSAGTVITPQTSPEPGGTIETSIYAEPATIDQQQANDSGKAVTDQPTETKTEPSNKQQVVVHKNPRSLPKTLFWLGLIVLAVVIVVDVMLDNGTLSLHIPHTHFLGH